MVNYGKPYIRLMRARLLKIVRVLHKAHLRYFQVIGIVRGFVGEYAAVQVYGPTCSFGYRFVLARKQARG